MFKNLAHFFGFLGVLDYIVLFRNAEWKMFSFNPFSKSGNINAIQDLPSDIDFLFPDKLKDMHRFAYKLVLMDQAPRLLFIKHGVIGIDNVIFSIIMKKQNARAVIAYKIHNYDPHASEVISYLLLNRKVDLTLTTGYHSSVTHRLQINTYDLNGYCALIPIPVRLSFLDFLLTPYDAFSWIFLFVSTAICAFVWKLFNRGAANPDSAWNFVFAIVANFLGQSIVVRENRRMQITLLQLCILMTFIMGNAYQSLIIASMSSSRDGIRFKTFEQMLASDNLKFKVDPTYYRILKESGEFSSFIDRSEVGSSLPDYKELAANNYALIGLCDMIESEYNVITGVGAADFFYLLPDKVMPFYEKFTLALRTPFREKLQMYHDYIFESGIRQYIKDLLKFEEAGLHARESKYIEKEEYLLTMDDVYGIFYILLVGYGISLMVLLLEIFWHGCMRHVGFRRMVQKALRRIRPKRRVTRVRRIQVQPAAEA